MGSGLHMDPLLPTLVGGLFATLLVGLVLRKLRQPHVIAYLVGGVLLGPHGLAVLDDEALVSRTGEFGVVLLLFFVGMEVSLKRLAEVWKLALLGTLLQVLLCLAAAALLGQALEWPLARIVLIGFAISLSSTAVVVSLLRGRDELDSPRGRDTLGILLAQDLALIPMLVVLGLLAGEVPSAGSLALQGLAGLAVMALLVLMARAESVTLPFGRLLRDDHELQVFGAFLVCFGCAWVTGLAGLSTATGAFVAGVVVSAASETSWVHRSLEPFRVILVAVFFVSVGMLIDLGFLVEHRGLVGLLVLATLTLNTLVNALVLRLMGRRLATSLIVGAMLAQVGEFSFVLAAVGLQAGIVSDFAHQCILALIAVTLVLSPAWIALVERLVGGLPPALEATPTADPAPS